MKLYRFDWMLFKTNFAVFPLYSWQELFRNNIYCPKSAGLLVKLSWSSHESTFQMWVKYQPEELSCHTYNISSKKEIWWRQFLNLYKAIIRHTSNSETIVNFEQKSNSQYNLSFSVCNWWNTFQQGVDIFRKTV